MAPNAVHIAQDHPVQSRRKHFDKVSLVVSCHAILQSSIPHFQLGTTR